jgi:hypothetical protein
MQENLKVKGLLHFLQLNVHLVRGELVVIENAKGGVFRLEGLAQGGPIESDVFRDRGFAIISQFKAVRDNRWAMIRVGRLREIVGSWKE